MAIIIASIFILLTVLNLTPAHAIINFYATGVHTGEPITPACADAGRVLRNYLKEFHHPAQWNYIIVCDDKAWAKVMEMYGLADPYQVGSNVFGTTSLKCATTFLRGESLTGKGDTRIPSEKIVAHELAHIFLNTFKEKPVEQLTDQWLADYHKRHPELASNNH